MFKREYIAGLISLTALFLSVVVLAVAMLTDIFSEVVFMIAIAVLLAITFGLAPGVGKGKGS